VINRGVAICTYNRGFQLKEMIDAVQATSPPNSRLVVCDDGSTDDTPYIVKEYSDLMYIRGPNLGVAANKNRALVGLRDCHFLTILEDDLIPQQPGWFETYENVYLNTGIHHFCRVQDKEIAETLPDFSIWLRNLGYTPIYGPSPRGDLTFLTAEVIRKVGGFNPEFRGAGYAHGEWSHRVAKSGLIPHPLRWIDIEEARDCFQQSGDTDGGRWLDNKKAIKQQLKDNCVISRRLRKDGYIHCPLVLE
jgi:glycosyltransferase involved in cell wall biosynthesis